MKYLTIILLFIVLSSSAQKKYKPDYLGMGLLFSAGACDGQVETLLHHYDQFKEVFPNANDNFWNPSESWKNKWADDSYKKEKFPLSSTALVWTTDAYHLFKMGQKGCIVGAITIKIGDKKKKPKYYLYDLVLYSLSYGAGFYTTYGIIYN